MQKIIFNNQERPKTLTVKLEGKAINYYYNGLRIGTSSAGLMEKYLKQDIQEFLNSYHFDVIEIHAEPEIDMTLLFGLEY